MGAPLEIVDSHHHLWDLEKNYYPWLTDRITKRVCGDYGRIRQSYLLDDFLRDAADVELVKSVHVQAEHDHADPVRESRWLQSVADCRASHGFPHAIVAYADFTQDNVAAVLEAHCACRKVRGIRQMLHESMLEGLDASSCLLEHPRWRRNFSVIEQFPLSFDLQVYYPQVPAACQLIKEHPDVQFVVCHMGQPVDRTVDALQNWQNALRRLAELPNTTIKISGVGMFDREWTLASLRPIVGTVIDIFGPSRCMFGSNFPVDKMMSSYVRLWSTFITLVGEYTLAEQQQMLAENAARVYRI